MLTAPVSLLTAELVYAVEFHCCGEYFPECNAPLGNYALQASSSSHSLYIKKKKPPLLLRPWVQREVLHTGFGFVCRTSYSFEAFGFDWNPYRWRLCRTGGDQTAGLSGRLHFQSVFPCPEWAGNGEAPSGSGPALEAQTDRVSDM